MNGLIWRLLFGDFSGLKRETEEREGVREKKGKRDMHEEKGRGSKELITEFRID